ncbi:MAG: NADH-quinone oxidoreductase subunit H [Chloroflexi bacterium]|nr:NADH-quinone oxidoreductase subunit H [Chloroflexota bacterium]
MNDLGALSSILILPGGLALLLMGLIYEYVNRKLIARLQNRMGPRWFQPLADVVKLLSKAAIIPAEAQPTLFALLPVISLAGVLTAGLYLPLLGLAPAYGFEGDLIITVGLLGLLTLCMSLAGFMTDSRYALVGALRTLTQLFSYEAPFLLALLGPALVAGTWQIDGIMRYAEAHTWILFTQPLGFVVAVIGLMAKLEMAPFDAPEAHTEIVAGPLTEYSGRHLALFRLSKDAAMVIGLTLVAGLYLGGIANPLVFVLKTLALLVLITGVQALFARFRIDQSMMLWWRYGVILLLVQWLITMVSMG